MTTVDISTGDFSQKIIHAQNMMRGYYSMCELRKHVLVSLSAFYRINMRDGTKNEFMAYLDLLSGHIIESTSSNCLALKFRINPNPESVRRLKCTILCSTNEEYIISIRLNNIILKALRTCLNILENCIDSPNRSYKENQEFTLQLGRSYTGADFPTFIKTHSFYHPIMEGEIITVWDGYRDDNRNFKAVKVVEIKMPEITVTDGTTNQTVKETEVYYRRNTPPIQSDETSGRIIRNDLITESLRRYSVDDNQANNIFRKYFKTGLCDSKREYPCNISPYASVYPHDELPFEVGERVRLSKNVGKSCIGFVRLVDQTHIHFYVIPNRKLPGRYSQSIRLEHLQDLVMDRSHPLNDFFCISRAHLEKTMTKSLKRICEYIPEKTVAFTALLNKNTGKLVNKAGNKLLEREISGVPLEMQSDIVKVIFKLTEDRKLLFSYDDAQYVAPPPIAKHMDILIRTMQSLIDSSTETTFTAQLFSQKPNYHGLFNEIKPLDSLQERRRIYMEAKPKAKSTTMVSKLDISRRIARSSVNLEVLQKGIERMSMDSKSMDTSS
ncbi:MAG: hypothetical protein WC222_03850 [Parachlamydiales bacterium]|jgi:hypothetical protein